jgi:uncharacterized repeat protein (TIGR03833 family)
MSITKRNLLKVGMEVSIVLKKDQSSGNLTDGIIQQILTNSPDHHRWIKVKLTDGRVGRVKEIIEL